MAKSKRQLGSGDFILVSITMALVVFGIIMVFSASYYWSIDKAGNPYSFFIKDIIWGITGTLIMFATICIDYRRYKKLALPLIGIGFILLVAVLLIGDNINGATRWISLGGITIMPGEIAKICVIIFAAWILSKEENAVNSMKNGILPLAAIAVLFGGLIMKQPNMSTAITLVGILVAMMFVAGLKLRYFVLAMGAGVVGALALIVSGGGYKLARATSFIDPFKYAMGDGYQVVQGLLAMGSGGITGLGIGKSLQKNLYLPEPQNDFILAIIGEELGFVAIIILMIAYMFLIWRGIKVAISAPDRFGMLLASGISIMIGIQVLLNVAVVTSSMPPTGVTLPFISYGGNALWLFMGSMGILINISRQRVRDI